MDAAELLRAWRKRRKLSLVKASREVDCDPTALSKLENRKQRPGRMLAQKIEAASGIRTEKWEGVVLAEKRQAS